MGKSKQQQPNSSTASKGDGEECDSLAGSTLEDYFATHKVSGHVSQHLLNISTENDVMAAEKVSGEDKESRGGPDRKLANDVDGRTKLDRKSESDDYEDDYESETPTPHTEPLSDIAGMTLSDYLHVKDDAGSAKAQEKISRAGSLQALPPQLAASEKKNTSSADVSGMSLDHYLGAESGGHKSTDTVYVAQAEKKPSPKVKRKGSKLKMSGPALPQAKGTQQPFSVKGSGLVQIPHATSSSQNVSSDEEDGSVSSPNASLTPFQRRQKRKDKSKIKQQRIAGGGSSISKAILMPDASSSPPTVLSVRDRDKRKASLTVVNHPHHPVHHSSHSSASNFQPPLPKLSASPSVRSISQKDHDGSEDDAAEKLPPL
ncbi:unnamed protein product [Phytophthora fragariaefolia]|uniref:Unnamed protein product n=1 Tax=Phytophthora fragariaefolia TaxID=1490495 RepID=A0A9W6XJ73_9STRA|nr:unnamed protein product [Phytophthora fragariaefolia]